jgi:hypothetical protein
MFDVGTPAVKVKLPWGMKCLSSQNLGFFVQRLPKFKRWSALEEPEKDLPTWPRRLAKEPSTASKAKLTQNRARVASGHHVPVQRQATVSRRMRK